MHPGPVCAVLGLTFLLSLGLCVVAESAARRLGLLDVPNNRSLHKVPVPRLGGAAAIVSLAIVLTAGAQFARIPLLQARDAATLLAGASAIAILGFVDDLRPLPAILRLAVQVCVSSVVLILSVRSTGIELAAGLQIHLPRTAAIAAGILFTVATTNIYNFMDGMDGLAAVQGIAASAVIGAACAATGQSDLAVISLAIAAATAGFLLRNAPPASIFLGDAGSTFLGFTLSSVAIVASVRSPPVPITVVPVALAPFLLDGTFTILRRLRRGERIWQAHRTHLYQRAVATGLSHAKVLVIYGAWCVGASLGALAVARAPLPLAIVVMAAVVVPLAAIARTVAGREARCRTLE